MAEKKKMSQKVDKRHRAKIIIPGVDKPIYLSGKTKKELEEKKAAAIEDYITGQKLQDKPFLEVLREWWHNEKVKHIKREATKVCLRQCIEKHVIPCFDERKLIRAVTIDDLQMCLDSMEGYCSSYVVRVSSVLRQVYAYAMRRKYVTQDLSLYLILPESSETKEKDFLTDDQATRLLRAAASEKYGIYIYLLYYLGVRRGEALALRWGDFDFERKTVHVQRTVTMGCKLSDGKTKAANRYIPVPTPLFNYLRPRRGMPSEYVIQNPRSTAEGHLMTVNCIHQFWNKMLYNVGLAKLSPKYIKQCNEARKAGKRPPRLRPERHVIPDITPHWLRHNYVSLLYDAGIDALTATKIVGHASYQTTADIYTHISEMRKAQAGMNLDHVFSKVAERLPNAL